MLVLEMPITYLSIGKVKSLGPMRGRESSKHARADRLGRESVPVSTPVSRYLKVRKLHADDTPVPLLAPGQGKTKRCACGPTFAMASGIAQVRLRGLPTRRIAKAHTTGRRLRGIQSALR